MACIGEASRGKWFDCATYGSNFIGQNVNRPITMKPIRKFLVGMHMKGFMAIGRCIHDLLQIV